MIRPLRIPASLALALAATPLTAQQYPHPLRGSAARITVPGPSLEGNLSGDLADRPVTVYLPPGYAEQTSRRYPVLYALHGYTDDDLHWMGWEPHFVNLATLVDSAIVAGRMPPLIVVMPNSYTRFQGSMYSNSITTGYWEEFVARDLVAFVDAHYRTIPERAGRGLTGHSMGGYGALRIGIRHPDVFAAVYALSPCCLAPRVPAGPEAVAALARYEAIRTMADFEQADFGTRAQIASAAAWTPNPDNPPFFIDLPTKNGELQPLVIAKLAANAPLAFIDQYIPNFRRLTAFGIDSGDQDRGIAPTVTELHRILERYGIAHEYGIYPGNHVNNVHARIASTVVPFFARHLSAGAAQERLVPVSDTITTGSGLRYVFLKRGSGPAPRPGDLMVIHGIGRFLDGREFWNTRTEGRPYEYRPGVDRVILGFEEGMRHVREGDRVEIIMKPELAYGQRGNREIPPGATLVFDYEILSVRQRPRLGEAEVGDIARLLLLEDRRQFDEAELARLLAAAHPEVRRRAVLAVARIADPRGRALLVPVRVDPDTAIAATVAWATGQLKDSAAVAWLGSLLASPQTPRTVAREAAGALGKVRSPEARAALARYLAEAPATRATTAAVGEALLAIGRFQGRADLAPTLRWTTSADSTIRWRAAWALFRPRDPAAVPHLLRLAGDSAGEVRFWAVRGLAPALVDTAGIPRSQAAAVLRAALADPDRRVRTEALRTLVLYDDEESFRAALKAMDDPDSWIAVSAAEGLGRFAARADVVVPRLRALAARDRPSALRTAAIQSLRRLGVADSLIPDAPAPPARPAATPAPPLAEADYGALVERWVVPAYDYQPRPRAVWETERGSIELELFAGDAPLAMERFVRLVESGAVVGTEFGRVVPNFVAQMRTIAGAAAQRDEVNRHGLLRGNLSWASSGLDTGRPGYTLGSTPQPHNEGDFTALGRVLRGMDVVDRIELGDHITAARMIR